MMRPELDHHTQDRLPSNLGNRMRSLLNIILGHAQLLGFDTSLDEEGRSQIREIEQAAKALTALAAELPDFSNAETKVVPLLGQGCALFDALSSVSAPRGQRVLVVEDNPVNQVVLRGLLESLGCATDTVENGREALAQWLAGDYGLILADLNMPVMDGFELVRAVRAKETAIGGRIPIVAITAATVSEVRAACRAAGMDDVLAKPIELDALRAVLRRWRIGQALGSDPFPPAVTPESALTGLFISTARQDLKDGCRLLQGRDGQGLADIMHKLKSSALSVGALSFSPVAADLERSARNGQWLEVERLFDELEKVLADFEIASVNTVTTFPMDSSGEWLSSEALHQAILNDEFEVYFQLKVDAVSLKPVGVEALARWHSARLGWVSPAVFIALAERHGLIGPLSELLLTKALFGGARLDEAGFPLTIAVNLSATWFAQPQLPEFILATLRVAGILTRRVVLEIAESDVIDVALIASDGLERLVRQGIGLTVDGFKPDFKCLIPLQRIGFSEFKLDRAWMTVISAEMLSKLEQLRDFGIAIVATGIETPDNLERARALKCELVQGHLIAEAMPVEDLVCWLQDRS